jgi:cation transport regulator ChaC
VHRPCYLGPEDEQRTAAIARSAHGPSGANREYVLRLAQELARIGAEVSHISAIARAVAAIWKTRDGSWRARPGLVLALCA